MSEINPSNRDELYDSSSFVIIKCLMCKQHFISYRKNASEQHSCDRCANIKPKYRNCVDCHYDFRPVFNWSEKCKPCSNIDHRVYKICFQCRRTFKQKYNSQLKCKRCYNPNLGERECQFCSTKFHPPFATSFSCSVCQFEHFTAESKF